MAVELGKSLKVSTASGHNETGPLWADDEGVYVVAKRKMFGRSHPGARYNVFAWSDVVSYRLGAPNQRQLAGSTTNAHHTQVQFRTATNVYSWELALDRTMVTNRLGPWLAQIPEETS
jgi:hypothetical protein